MELKKSKAFFSYDNDKISINKVFFSSIDNELLNSFNFVLITSIDTVMI